MFAAAFASILAKELGYALQHHPSGYLPSDWFPNLKAGHDGIVCANPDIEVNDMLKDFAVAMSCCRGRRVIVRGFFERAEFYIPHREFLLNLFDQDLSGVEKHDVVFHVRGTDFVTEGRILSPGYYIQAWEMLGKPEKAAIVTDDAECAARLFFPLPIFPNINIVSSASIVDFKVLRSAKNIVCSDSTFAWWAAFLSNAETIIQPIVNITLVRNLINPNWKQIPA